MLALTGKASRVSVESVESVSPAAIWQAIAQAPQQFVLIGDADHSADGIRHEVRRALPQLAEGGVRHLGLEYPHEDVAPVMAAFNAPTTPHSLFNRIRGITTFSNQHLGMAEMPFHWTAMYRLFSAASTNNIRLHALDATSLRHPDPAAMQKILHLIKPVDEQVKAENRELSWGLRAFLAAHRYCPPALTEAERVAFDMYGKSVRFCALKGDWQRAHMLRVAANGERAALLYGYDHFCGRHIEGISHALAPDEQITVAIGTRSFMLREYPNKPTLRLPDFVVMTDQQVGHVTPQAVKRGLWPCRS